EDRSGARPSVSGAAEAEASPAAEPAPGAGQDDTSEEAGLALHTFAMVFASGPEITTSGAITAALSFDAGTIALPADQLAQAKIDIYARRPPPEKSFRVGSTVANISPGGLVQIQIPCDLPPNGYPVSLFAAVRLFTATAGRPPSSVLPEAHLMVSRASAAMPGKRAAQPDPRAEPTSPRPITGVAAVSS